MLASLENGNAAAAAPAPSAAPSITAFEKEGLRITFAFSKPVGRPEQTDVRGTYTNAGPVLMSNFILQVFVGFDPELYVDVF